VQLLGGVSFDRLLEEFRRAAVLVLPSMEETSPVVIGEAMAARLPVVATRVGGVAYLVDDGMTGYLVEAGDVEALGERIAAILGDPERQASLGAAGRAKADRNFRTAAVAARVRAVWEEVLAISRG
jgi:glycosyltransferase involved in cell wall biosynthesis